MSLSLRERVNAIRADLPLPSEVLGEFISMGMWVSLEPQEAKDAIATSRDPNLRKLYEYAQTNPIGKAAALAQLGGMLADGERIIEALAEGGHVPGFEAPASPGFYMGESGTVTQPAPKNIGTLTTG